MILFTEKCAVAQYLTKYSVETIRTCIHLQRKTMKYISNKMLIILERLSEMFPDSTYQTRLDQYLRSKGITDAAQLENYINEFNYNKEKYI